MFTALSFGLTAAAAQSMIGAFSGGAMLGTTIYGASKIGK